MRTGVYFLLSFGKVVYIGQTTRYPNRISEHGHKEFDDVRFIECSKDCLKAYEIRWILRFKPKYNIKIKCVMAQHNKKRDMSLRLDPSIIKRIEERAEKEQRSKNNLVEFVLNENI